MISLNNRPFPTGKPIPFPFLLLSLFFLFLFHFSVKAQCGTCDYTETSLTSSSPLSTIPAGKVLCITTNLCMGTGSVAGGCPNNNIGSLIINGTLRICSGITFSFSGTITGTGKIEILSNGRMNMTGTYDCSVGLVAVDPTISSGTSTLSFASTGSCSYPNCNVTYSNGYSPFGNTAPGMGITAYNGSCAVKGEPSNIIVLPLQLTDWEAAWKGTDILLSWVVPGDDPGPIYEVDYSKDGVSWQALSRVLGGVAVTSYDYLASGPFGDRNFFRLKQTDAAGAISYSPVKELDAGTEGDDHLFIGPNPVHSMLIIRSEGLDQQFGLQIVNITGTPVLTLPFSNTEQYNLESLPAGPYVLLIHRSNGTQLVKKITKL